eukprot:scaffold5605_cov128-Cylindrotheca_fusiformis.AAC.27
MAHSVMLGSIQVARKVLCDNLCDMLVSVNRNFALLSDTRLGWLALGAAGLLLKHPACQNVQLSHCILL